MLHIDQSTVSKYVGKFKAMVDQRGMDAALLQVGVGYNHEETEAIVAEFQKSDLTIADIAIALQIEKVLQQSGVKHEAYHSLIQTAKKATNGGFMAAALELHKLEEENAMTYGEVVLEAQATSQQLEKQQAETQKLSAEISVLKAEKAEIETAKKKASADLALHMKQIGIDEERLQKVEALALALKKAKVPDTALPAYIERQEALNKAGIGIDVFHQILQQVHLATASDGGKLLLSLLTEYNGLAATLTTQQAKKEELDKKVSNLEQLVQFRAQLANIVEQLKGEKAHLDSKVAELQAQVQEMEKARNHWHGLASYEYAANKELAKQKAAIEAEIAGKKALNSSLDKQIKSKQEHVIGLAQLESKHDALVPKIAEMEERVIKEGKRWLAFEGFLGLLQGTSPEELQKWVDASPALLEEVKEGKRSPGIVRNFILKSLAGPRLQVLKCSCGARIYFDGNPALDTYVCPSGTWGHVVTVDKNATEILKAAMSESNPTTTTITMIDSIMPSAPPASEPPGPPEESKA